VLRSAIVFLLLAAFSAAETPSATRGKKVIDDAIAALGGDKFLQMEDRIETGRAYSFYRDSLSGLSIAKIYTRYLAVDPTKSAHELGQRERQSFGKNEDSAVVLREDGGANITYRGPKPIPVEDFERYRETTLHNIFYILRQRLHEPGMDFENLSDLTSSIECRWISSTSSMAGTSPFACSFTRPPSCP
jgi:hypothetical protein